MGRKLSLYIFGVFCVLTSIQANVHFDSTITPFLQNHCFKCHGPGSRPDPTEPEAGVPAGGSGIARHQPLVHGAAAHGSKEIFSVGAGVAQQPVDDVCLEGHWCGPHQRPEDRLPIEAVHRVERVTSQFNPIDQFPAVLLSGVLAVTLNRQV